MNSKFDVIPSPELRNEAVAQYLHLRELKNDEEWLSSLSGFLEERPDKNDQHLAFAMIGSGDAFSVVVHLNQFHDLNLRELALECIRRKESHQVIAYRKKFASVSPAELALAMIESGQARRVIDWFILSKESRFGEEVVADDLVRQFIQQGKGKDVLSALEFRKTNVVGSMTKTQIEEEIAKHELQVTPRVESVTSATYHQPSVSPTRKIRQPSAAEIEEYKKEMEREKEEVDLAMEYLISNEIFSARKFSNYTRRVPNEPYLQTNNYARRADILAHVFDTEINRRSPMRNVLGAVRFRFGWIMINSLRQVRSLMVMWQRLLGVV